MDCSLALRKLHIFLISISILFSGCFWKKDVKNTDTVKDDTTGTTLPGSTIDKAADSSADDEESRYLSKLFSIKNKIDEVRFQYMEGQASYALTQAKGVLPMLKPDSKQRLELYFLMARCCEKLGREKDRKHHDKAFRELIEKLGKSKEHKDALKAGKNVRKLIEQSIKKAEPLREKSVFDSDDELFNLRCFRKLKRVDKNQVIEEEMEDSGRIFYGKKANNVIAQAASAIGLSEADIIIHKDPRFYFYYTIIEGAH